MQIFSAFPLTTLRGTALLTVLLAAGCAGNNDGNPWPTLAPRAGEISPLVPRTPLGACATCGPDGAPVTVAEAAPPPPPPPAAPTDAASRLAVSEAVIVDIEARWPEQRKAGLAALAATAGAAAEDAAAEREVQLSRLEAIFLPLGSEEVALDELEEALLGTTGSEPLLRRLAELRTRIDRLQAIRDIGLDPAP